MYLHKGVRMNKIAFVVCMLAVLNFIPPISGTGGGGGFKSDISGTGGGGGKLYRDGSGTGGGGGKL